jgi:hypothetical protein
MELVSIDKMRLLKLSFSRVGVTEQPDLSADGLLLLLTVQRIVFGVSE